MQSIAVVNIDFFDKVNASVNCSFSACNEQDRELIYSQLFISYYTKTIFNLGNAPQLAQNLRSVVKFCVNNTEQSVFHHFKSNFMLIKKPATDPLKTYSAHLVEDNTGNLIINTKNSMGDEDHFAPLSVLMLLEFLRQMASDKLNTMLANGVLGTEEIYKTGDCSSLQTLHEATRQGLQFLDLSAEEITCLLEENAQNNNGQIKIPPGINSILLHFRKVANSFPENDFFRDFFYALEYGCFTAFAAISGYNEEVNDTHINFSALQEIEAEEALEFVKLSSSFFLYKLLNNQDNINFLIELGITPDRLENYVHKSLGFSKQDVRRYQKHKGMFFEEPQEYALALYDDINSLVLNRSTDTISVEASLLPQMLSFAYDKGFMNYFNI